MLRIQLVDASEALLRQRQNMLAVERSEHRLYPQL